MDCERADGVEGYGRRGRAEVAECRGLRGVLGGLEGGMMTRGEGGGESDR